MDELAQINVIAAIEVQDRKESLTYDAWKIRVSQQSDFIYAFVFVIRLRNQILIDILEVRNGNILFELFIVDDLIVHKFNLFIAIRLHNISFK